MASGQCHVAECGELIFAICHDSSYTRQEKSGARKFPLSIDLGVGLKYAVFPTFGEHYLRYFMPNRGSFRLARKMM